MSDTRQRLRELGWELPVLSAPRYAYAPSMRWGELLWVSGQISRTAEGTVLGGVVGADATVADGVAAAEVATLNLLARIEEAVGLDAVRQVLKLQIWVSSAVGFIDQPTVADGASRLLRNVFGDAGAHARTALPTPGLPQGALVELDATVAVRD